MLASLVSLFTTYINADGVNITPIISYLLCDTSTVTPKEIAIDKIKAYADNQDNPVPTLQDYTNAEVTGVTEENIADVNSNIADKMASEVDTTEKIQAIVDSVIDNSISFASDVMPILEANCKSCHAKTSSRTFKVDDTAYTHANIIGNGLINTTSPDLSLILIKGNGGDGHKIKLTDDNSNIIKGWIEQGGLNN